MVQRRTMGERLVAGVDSGSQHRFRIVLCTATSPEEGWNMCLVIWALWSCQWKCCKNSMSFPWPWVFPEGIVWLHTTPSGCSPQSRQPVYLFITTYDLFFLMTNDSKSFHNILGFKKEVLHLSFHFFLSNNI